MENPFNSQVSLLQASCGTEIGLLPRAANPCVFITRFSEWEGFIHISLWFFFSLHHSRGNQIAKDNVKTVIISAQPQKTKKDPVLLLVVKADRQEKMPLFFLSQSQEFHLPKHQAQGALSPRSSASRNTSHC